MIMTSRVYRIFLHLQYELQQNRHPREGGDQGDDGGHSRAPAPAQRPQQRQTAAPAPAQRSAGSGFDDMDDSIPF